MEENQTKYYIRIKGELRGPFPLEQLPAEGVRPSTYVWCDGMEDWERAGDVAEICRLFRCRIHDLMHPGSVAAEQQRAAQADMPLKYDENPSPTRFDRHLDEGERLPTLEEIDAREDHSKPPTSMVVPSILVAVLFSPILGLVGVYYAFKSRSAWKNGEKDKAYDYNRSAKMWTGIALFLTIIFAAIFLRGN